MAGLITSGVSEPSGLESMDGIDAKLRIAIPASVAVREDDYWCTMVPVVGDYQAIKAFIPEARQEVAHHMIVNSCGAQPEPLNTKKVKTKEGKEIEVWNCKRNELCPSSSNQHDLGKILYAWAKGAGRFDADADAGVLVGSRTGIDAPYIVLQAHFLNAVSEETKEEEAAVEMVMTSEFPDKVLSINLFSNSHFKLPAKRDRLDVKAKCCMKGSGTTDLFAYRVHAHDFARNISLSIFNETVVSGDPQVPHYFEKDRERHELKLGTDWEVTCSYNTQQANQTVYVGKGANNEMCNMYLMVSSSVPYTSNCYGGFNSMIQNNPDVYIQADLAYLGETLEAIKVIKMPSLGQVAGVHLGYQGNPDHMLIFHRADREMNQYDHDDRIREDVLVVWDTKENKVVSTFGGNLFRLPHGLTIDRDNNIWLTDVDSQLAYKLDPSGQLLLTVGEEGRRGHDARHLCRPTEVAVSNDGHFYVSDGYCNSHVMKYNATTGAVVEEVEITGGLVVHSLVLDDCTDMLYVADREGKNIRLIHLGSADGKGKEITRVDVSMYGNVYSVTQDQYGNVYALVWDRNNPAKKVYFVQLQVKEAFTLEDALQVMAIELPGIKIPHDFTVSYNFKEHALDVWVGETGPGPHGKVTLFRVPL